MKSNFTKEEEEQMLIDFDEAINAPRMDHKIRVSFMMEGDILDTMKQIMDDTDQDNSTVLNDVLRKALGL